MSDEFGDRMKMYEMLEAGRKVFPRLPILVRADGKAFHTYTKNLTRPFDERFQRAMNEAMKDAVDFTNARVGYVQSDEISLIILPKDREEVVFGGRIQKLVSLIAARISVAFNAYAQVNLIGNLGVGTPLFDCRVWSVPSEEEAVNALLWREQDATKNSIQAAARSAFTHKEVDGKTTKEMLDMLMTKDINWNDYPSRSKRGAYARRVTRTGVFTSEELEQLPPKHMARRDPTLTFSRSSIEILDLPRLSSVSNRVDVLLHGAEPIVYGDPETIPTMSMKS